MKTLLTGVLLLALTLPTTGCIPLAVGFLVGREIKRSMAEDAAAKYRTTIVTTNCTKDANGIQTCTTTTS